MPSQPHPLARALALGKTQQSPAWMGRLGETWPGKLASALAGAVMEPGRVMREGVDDSSIERMADLAGALALGGTGAAAALPRGANQLGIFGGRLAKTAPLDDLARAEAMEAAGTSADDIWRATGWGKGADGQWRFEIPDDQARTFTGWQRAMNESEKGGSTGRLSDTVEHPEAFAAYPEVGGIRTVAEARGGSGSYGPVDDIESMYISGDLPNDLKSTALHEMQHAVQAREGFARGGNPRTPGLQQMAQEIAQQAANDFATLDNQMRSFQIKWIERQGIPPNDMDYTRWMAAAAKEWKKEFPDLARQRDQAFNDMEMRGGRAIYQRLAGEVEARNASARMDMTPDQRRATPPWTTEDVPRAQQIVRGR